MKSASALSLKFLLIVALATAGISVNAVLMHALSRAWETALALAFGSSAGAILLLWVYLGVDRGTRERATRENDARYKMLFDVHPIPMWIFDAETFRFLAVNPAAVRDYGYGEAEFLGMSTLDIRSPLERVRLAAYLQSRPVHGKASSAMEAGIWQHTHKSGAIIHAEISYSHLTFEGRPAYVVLANNVTARMSAEDAAQRSNQMLECVIDSIPQRVFWKDRESRYLGCNRAFARDAGLAFPEQVIGRRDASLPWANYAAGISAIDQEVLSAGVAQIGYEVELEIQGIAHTVVASTLPLTDGGGRVIGILGTYSDITARKRAELALRLQSRALDASVNAILITVATETGNLIEYVNPAFRRITGYEPSEVIGLDCKFLQHDDCDQEGVRSIREALRAGREITAVLRNYRKDGALFWNQLYIAPVPGPDGVVTHHISVINDVTELIRYQEQLEYQANYDGLTRLPNRNLLRDRLAHALSRARLEGTRVAVVFLDLDGFKNVNDSLGHSVGDKLLVAIGERLAACARGTDTVARHGGDEFVMLLDNAADNASLANWLDRVRGAVAEPIRLEGMELYVGCSLGVSVFPEDGDDAETLLQKADVAMYRAKELGRNSFQFYQPEMNASASARLDVETRLRRALRDGEFLLHYQPQVDLRSGQIIGLEALIRWQDPDIGLISPASFIPVAEDSGLIAEIGEWVMREACRQNKAWQDAGLPRVRMSVNVSAKQFDRRDIATLVRSILAQTGLDARYLELELTESAIMRNAEDAVATLAELHALGIGLSIDDFGTGYSSLSFLKRFPVDRLKIDRSFVSDIGWSDDDESITTAIIMLGHSLAMKVLAEGVETAAQLDFLRERHCDEMQGFHFARPMPAQAVADLLREHFDAQRASDLEDRVSARHAPGRTLDGSTMTAAGPGR